VKRLLHNVSLKHSTKKYYNKTKTLLEKYYYLGLHMDDMVPTPQQEVTNSISEIIAYFLKSKNVM